MRVFFWDSCLLNSCPTGPLGLVKYQRLRYLVSSASDTRKALTTRLDPTAGGLCPAPSGPYRCHSPTGAYSLITGGQNYLHLILLLFTTSTINNSTVILREFIGSVKGEGSWSMTAEKPMVSVRS